MISQSRNVANGVNSGKYRHGLCILYGGRGVTIAVTSDIR